MSDAIEWRTASPLWSLALQDSKPGTRLRQPSLLRFGSDDFMEKLQTVLAHGPSRLQEFVLADEDWQREVLEPERVVGWRDENDPLASIPKLYQPIHGRFYLLTANLVCRQQGLPDHKVDQANGEKVSSVVRRLRPVGEGEVDVDDPSSFTELAWTIDGQQGSWVSASANALVAEEEQLPLFPLNFEQAGQPRRLWMSLVPTTTSRTQAIVTEGEDGDEAPLPDDYEPRVDWFDSRVGQSLIQCQASVLAESLETLTVNSPSTAPIIEISRFWLLDLAEYLRDQIEPVWLALQQGNGDDLAASTKAIYDFVNAAVMINVSGNSQDLSDALQAVDGQRTVLLQDGHPLNEQDLRYDISTLSATFSVDLRDLVEAWTKDDATPKAGLPKALDMPVAAKQEAPSESEPGDGSVFVLRCVYQRPQCTGGEAQLLSEPSVAFRFSDFFDVDAPARPLQISMPADTGIAHMRRFKRGVSIAVSTKFRNQMERIRGVTMGDVDDGKLHKQADFSFGMICSLSIPIITIVALILLMIMVQLLNFVFWWLPFLKVCLPKFGK